MHTVVFVLLSRLVLHIIFAYVPGRALVLYYVWKSVSISILRLQSALFSFFPTDAPDFSNCNLIAVLFLKAGISQELVQPFLPYLTLIAV